MPWFGNRHVASCQTPVVITCFLYIHSQLHNNASNCVFYSQPLPTESRKDFAYMFIHALDTENMDLLQSFKEAIKFIEDGRQAGGVLVHW